MLHLNLSKKAAKALKKLHPKHERQVAQRVEELRSNPRPHDSEIIDNKKEPPVLRNTIGEYRIIYSHDDKELKITIIGSRNDSKVYKQFNRIRKKR
jgi:mRNA interferase RelE/StbE